MSDYLEPLVVKPKGAEKLGNWSHKRVYQFINSGELVSYKDGRSRKITAASIKALIARQLEKEVRV
jgi:hypothetical protein